MRRTHVGTTLLALLALLTLLALATACDDTSSNRPRDDAAIDGGPDAADVIGDADADAELPDPEERLKLAGDLAITKISLFQSVEIPIWRDGDALAPSAIVIVPDRTLRVVVWAAPQNGYSARPLTLMVSVIPAAGDPVDLQATVTFPAASDPANPATAVFLELPASLVPANLGLSVRILDEAAAQTPETQPHPARAGTLTAPLAVAVEPAQEPVRLILIPIRYQDGGQDFLPDTSPAQLALYETLLEATYPGGFELVLHAELAWDDPFTWTGNFDFGDLNGALVDLKASEGEAPESYYYALVAPADTFSDYCGGSCTTGQSYEVSNPGSADYRVGGGMGFSGENSAWTLVHELGHMFGRSHTGCDVSRDDDDYPYSGGMLGSWGLDPRSGAWIDPADCADFMGYCDPTWVSDYTWNGLYDRIVELAQLYPPAAPSPVRLLHVNLADGTLRVGALLTAPRAPGDRTVRVLVSDAKGPREIDAPAVFQSGGTAFTLALPAGIDARSTQLPDFPHLTRR
ncbi:hypothetical protein KKD52_10710 [Myxococcota bacterium]|nr:hypothetical protein [Myxococcota bacterium]MBU1413168.1 hypothetical protein [Myxococcota bacterium]MBU1510822.1 hypothetical protein [Myxococcota bacterium]